MGNSNYHFEQKIESINGSPRRLETLLHVAITATITGDSNNNDDSGSKETHKYKYDGEGVDIYDEDTAEEIISIIDRINWERVY